MHIKDYNARQVPKGSKGCRESKKSKECRGYKGCESMGVLSNLLNLVMEPRYTFQFTSMRLTSMLSASV